MTGVTDAVRAAIVAARAPGEAASRAWREGPAFKAAADAFAACAPDSIEDAAERAQRLLAGDWASALLAPLVGALAADPFFEPPLKVQRSALRTGAVLFDCSLVSIAASVTRAAAMATLPPARTIVFTGRMSVTRTVKAGGAQLRRWRTEALTSLSDMAAECCLPSEPIVLRDGLVHRTDGRTEAQLLSGARGDVVSLVATIKAGAAPLMREYDLASGRLLRVGDSDDRSSRVQMLLRLLRAAGRADAGNRFGEVTRAPDAHLRWAAMREWLALDAGAAAGRLAEMAAADPCGKVRAAAGQTLPIVETRLAEAACRA